MMSIKEDSFSQKCYELLKKIPKGSVTTYQEIAHALNTKAYRAVGSAMRKNPHPISIPCHRVVKSNGNIGEYIKGSQTKIDLLRSEGLKVEGEKIIDLEAVLFKF